MSTFFQEKRVSHLVVAGNLLRDVPLRHARLLIDVAAITGSVAAVKACERSQEGNIDLNP